MATDPISFRLAAGSGPTFGVDDLACAAATKLGCWEEEGLLVSWTPALGGVKAMSMALDGAVDAAYGGLGPVLKLRAGGAPLRIVSSMARALAQNLVAQGRLRTVADLTAQGRPILWAVDGIGALSHHMGRVVVAALGVDEAQIDWRVVGPPPERIAALKDGSVDVSLIRVEEALALSLDPADDLHTLLGFSELKRLAPLQPHGVLATTETVETEQPEALARLARGIIRASRRLDASFDDFKTVYEHYVTVSVPAAEVERIWSQERDAGGFAVNGEMTAAHWDAQIAAYAALEPSLPPVTREAVLSERFVRDALGALGVEPGPDAPA